MIRFDQNLVELTGQAAGNSATFVADSRGLATINASGEVRGGGYGLSDDKSGDRILCVLTFRALKLGSAAFAPIKKSASEPFGCILVKVAGTEISFTQTTGVSVTVAAGNTPPVANAQSVTTNEDTSKPITLTGSDADGNALTFMVVSNPSKGTLSGTPPAVTYKPNANYNGADSFTFKVNDGLVDSALATVSITVTAVNDAPACALTEPANGATFTAPASIAMTATASDIDGNVAKVEFFNGATKLGEDTSSPYAYTWSGVAAGSYTLNAKATDNNGATKTSANVSITVQAPNKAPVAQAQSVSTVEDETKAITLVGTDADGDTLIYLIVSAPGNGTLSGTPPTVTYNPAANYNGTDSFTFKVNDGLVDSAVATVSITVTPMNDDPVCALTAPGNGASFTAPASIVLQATASDIDDTIAKVEFFNGETILGEDISSPYEYTWSDVAAGSYTLTAKATDNAGATKTSDTVAITVSALVSVTATDASAGEPGLVQGSGIFNVSRSGDLSAALVVNYAMSGTAENGVDYKTLSGTVTLGVNQASVNVTLTPLADAADEPDETATLKLLAGPGYAVDGGQASGTVTIKDQTYGTPTVSAVASDAAATEPGLKTDKGAIKISRTGSTHEALTVQVTRSGTASNGVDYTNVSVPVTLSIGLSSKTISIAPLADAVVESAETVILTIQANAAYVIVSGKGVATVTIADNTQLATPTVSVVATDASAAEPGATTNTGTLTFSRTSRFHEALVVNYVLSGTATKGVDYNTLSGTVTIPVGAATKTLKITPIADGVAEGTETVVLQISASGSYVVDGSKASATVTIAD